MTGRGAKSVVMWLSGTEDSQLFVVVYPSRRHPFSQIRCKQCLLVQEDALDHAVLAAVVGSRGKWKSCGAHFHKHGNWTRVHKWNRKGKKEKKKKHSNLFYHSCFLFLLDWHCQAGVSVRRRQSNIVKAFKKMEPAISKEKASHGRQKVLLMQR